jgi:ankyrin repeat protein
MLTRLSRSQKRLQRFVFLLLGLFFASVVAAADNYDLMMRAIERNDVVQVKVLIAGKIDPNLRKDSRASPTFMTFAAYHGRAEILQLLLGAGADVNSADGDMQTPLMQASSRGHVRAVKLLLESGARLNEVSRWGDTALTQAREAGHGRVAKLLIKAGATP